MEVNRRWQRHHSERELHVQQLLNTIAELRAAPPSAPVEPPSKEVRSYKDDWEAERREKQAAEERCLALQRQVDALTIKVSETQGCCGRHICGSSSEPIMASSSAARCRRRKGAAADIFANKLRDVKLPDNIVLDSPPPYGNIVLDSPPPYGSSSTVETAPITIGFEGGLASVQSFSIPDANKKLSVLEIAAPPSERKVFKDWDRNVEEDNIMLTQTQENVACPRCGRVFPPDKHLQFLDHFDECQEYGKPPRVACDN
ncbi:hypothetical protein B566_EDAN005024 [Ephemera danica]|nr:hypothetical protein B566_EDAN005024 [Ephemera danica]